MIFENQQTVDHFCTGLFFVGLRNGQIVCSIAGFLHIEEIGFASGFRHLRENFVLLHLHSVLCVLLLFHFVFDRCLKHQLLNYYVGVLQTSLMIFYHYHYHCQYPALWITSNKQKRPQSRSGFLSQSRLFLFSSNDFFGYILQIPTIRHSHLRRQNFRLQNHQSHHRNHLMSYFHRLPTTEYALLFFHLYKLWK